MKLLVKIFQPVGKTLNINRLGLGLESGRVSWEMQGTTAGGLDPDAHSLLVFTGPLPGSLTSWVEELIQLSCGHSALCALQFLMQLTTHIQLLHVEKPVPSLSR